MITSEITQTETEVFDIIETDNTTVTETNLKSNSLPKEFFQFFEIEETIEEPKEA